MSCIEGFGNNAFNSLYGNEAIISEGQSAKTVSEYQQSVLDRVGTSFNSYKRPTSIQKPRGEYDLTVGAPTAMTASEYMMQKYGDFASATTIVPTLALAQSPTQTQIIGVNALTLGDLKLLQNAVDLELIRLQNIRSVSPLVTIKIGQLQVLAENLGDVVGRVDRGEIRGEDVAIFPASARQFLKTFRVSEALPELFDTNGNSPSSLAPTAAPTAAPTVTAATTTTATTESAKASSNLLQWLYENIQFLKWAVAGEYRIEETKQREISDMLDTMEKRVLGYSYTDTPMPAGYQKMFLERIRGLQKELNEVPE